MSALLESLLQGMEYNCAGSIEDVEVNGIRFSSLDVVDGDIFFCIVGEVVDGHSFAQDAIDRGACAIVSERALYIDNGDVPIIIVPNTKKAMGEMSSRLFGDPSRDMSIIGVTGTNGKTTTTYLISHILSECGHDCGIMGTTGAYIRGEKLDIGDRTTPESPIINMAMDVMRDDGCDSCAMEVSSHALALGRVWGIDFAVTAFTNLTQDHLDYHHSFDEYFEAKARLFSSEYPAKRVINIDNEWGQELYDRCSGRGDEVITYAMFGGDGDDQADIYPTSCVFRHDSTDVTMKICGMNYSFSYPLVGRFNMENVMCAIACAVLVGCDVKAITNALGKDMKVPGRMEHVAIEGITNDKETREQFDIPNVYVDYAHTPDAVAKAAGAAAMLKDDVSNKTTIVVGCGGDRDKEKRPLMAQASLARMDKAIITSDNPRTEDPDEIISGMVAGVKDPKYDGRYVVVSDRREAIEKAIIDSRCGDVVLIAGKGHEDYQIVGKEKRHFDDREVAAEVMRVKAGRN